ncbi:MAG: 4Fe-4S dicluster domain-containing protein [Proteobacteria bacterium]|nr:4Fe-4S dicluster domain-containing protein [Pseudomonadota bacterium]
MATERLKEIARKVLSRDDVKCLIGYRRGSYGFRISPCFLTSPDEAEQLVISPLCLHNLATYLTAENIGPLVKTKDEKKNKIALMVKGCDSKAITNLIAEKGIDRESIIIIGIPCTGVVDIKKLEARFPRAVAPATVEIKDGMWVVAIEGTTVAIPLDELLAEKCKRCKHPTPLVYDELAGDPVAGKEDAYDDVKGLETQALEERLLKWQEELGKCIRCYACKNVCPLCYCSDCALDRLRPQLIRRSVSVPENLLFQVTRAFHLAGRCIACGECERVCPQGLPLMELNRKLAKDVQEIFGYETGLDPEAKPILSTFTIDDTDEGIL